jgi:hypothetical protein
MNVYQIITTNDGVFSYTVYLKKDATNLIETYIYQTFGAAGFKAKGEINFDNGTFTTTLGTGTIESVGNGWFRVNLSATLLSGANSFGIFTTSSTGTRSVFVWGAQLNIGSTAKPYFPTTDRLNVPRLTYQNGGGGCPSLLLEKQSTNLQLYSEDFRNIAEGGATNTWTPNDTLILSTNNTAPDGTLTATRIRGNGSNRARQAVIFGTMGSPYSGSIFIRRVSGSSTIELRVGDVSQVSSINPTSSWQRFTHTASPTSTAIRLAVVFSNNTDEFEIWGAQLEASSYPTSYIPTTSSSATRVADACFKTGISSLIGQTEGTIFVEINRTQRSENYQPVISLQGASSAQLIELYFGSANTLILGIYNSGAQYQSASGVISNGTHKIAIAYKQNDFAYYIDGVQISTDNSGTVPALSQFALGTFTYTTGYELSDGIKQAVLFKTRLTNSELASLTTL